MPREGGAGRIGDVRPALPGNPNRTELHEGAEVIPRPKSKYQAAQQGLADATEAVELVHDCERDYVWSTLESWSPTRLAVAVIVLAAGQSTDASLTARLDWVRDLVDDRAAA